MIIYDDDYDYCEGDSAYCPSCESYYCTCCGCECFTYDYEEEASYSGAFSYFNLTDKSGMYMEVIT